MHKGCKSSWKAAVNRLPRYSAGSYRSALRPPSPDAQHMVHAEGLEAISPPPRSPATVTEEVEDSGHSEKKRRRKVQGHSALRLLTFFYSTRIPATKTLDAGAMEDRDPVPPSRHPP